MARQFSQTLDHAAAPAEVLEMLLDPAFRTEVCRAQHVTSQDVSVTRDGDRAQVTVEQVQQVRGVPSVVTKLVGESITVRQEEQWAGEQADVTLTISGQKGRIGGTTRLVARGTGTQQVIDWEIEVNLPLVGKKVADIIAGLLDDALAVEHQVAQAWLAG